VRFEQTTIAQLLVEAGPIRSFAPTVSMTRDLAPSLPQASLLHA